MELVPSTHTARAASLRFADCRAHGIRRVRRGRGFAYLTPAGARLKDPAHLDRIRALAIPPAWQSVWICSDHDGHLQATGTDARGRKQYRYHAHWTAHRNAAKFAALVQFARVLPRIRRRVARDLSRAAMPKGKVVACIVHLLDQVHIRIGNDRYAEENDSYGLTTIRRHHAKVKGSEVRFSFRAKSGKRCDARVNDPAIARIVRRCQELPGQELFSFVDDDGVTRDVTSGDVNEYLALAAAWGATAKDFRTWGGTVVAAQTLLSSGHHPVPARPLSDAEIKRREVAAVKAASAALSNTVATCRKFYVHPQLIGWYRAGRLGHAVRATAGTRTPRELDAVERALAWLLNASIASVRRQVAAALQATRPARRPR